MPPKKKALPQPIDRPLSRAYLREFSGWSTAYPPGLSEPTSLRKMENVLINREGSARIRPGLRYLSYSELPELDPVTDEVLVPGVRMDESPVSSHEAFYLNDGSLAYLFAVREDDGTVSFRVFSGIVHDLTWAGFTFEPNEASLSFTAATRYVRFLQIDNKIFALSDAGETMRMFTVGTEKLARVLNAITRPDWVVTDKLTVVHPDQAWIAAGTPISFRTNLLDNPSLEESVFTGGDHGEGHTRSSDFAFSGTYSVKLESLPQRTNYMTQPLHDVNSTGDGAWYESTNANMVVHAGSNSLQWTIATAASPGGPEGEDMKGWLAGPLFDIDSGSYRLGLDVIAASNVRKMGFKAVWFDAAGAAVGSPDIFLGSAPALGRKVFSMFTRPSAARKVRLYFSITRDNGAASTHARINNVTVTADGASTAALDGDMGADYFWVGTVNGSQSVYHPPATVSHSWMGLPFAEGEDYAFSAYVRAGTVARNGRASLVGFGMSTISGVNTPDAAGAWTRYEVTGTPDGAVADGSASIAVFSVPRGEYHYVDAALLEKSATVESYFDGSTLDVVGVLHDWTGTPHESTSTRTEYGAAVTVPTPETRAANTLVATSDNDYSFGFFYTFSNEIGESAASQATIVKTKRPWSGWEWKPPEADGEPDMTADDLVDPALAADQLVAIIPEDVFTQAVGQGAVKWTLYMFTWSNQDPVPVSALKVGVRELEVSSDYQAKGWLAVTPAQSDYGTDSNVLPSLANRYNFSNPSRAGQGLVAADRMVLVKDPTAAAVIRWTSNQQGEYTNFSASKGGGYKTLTSGNLQIPACVKLWQNPESKDTLTILTLGTDGYSTGYYMAPAQVASQSEATNIMGFEETTATPGTTSPYGCEIVNNTLYHPIEDMLMKSTASNYNINHKSVTDQIQNFWRQLRDKEWIISSVLDNRIYLIVNNPLGEELEENCNGNEIWVFDAQAEAGNWSRFLIQAVSLRKLEQGDAVRMSVVRPDGIFYLDEDYYLDDYVNGGGEIESRPIAWYMETNTQGANRAHDAWCYLQQLDVMVGNFTGHMRYGLHGWDVNGRAVDREKILSDELERDLSLPWDVEDQLQITRYMKEWFFFAGSVLDEEGAVRPSRGQFSLVQYRYAPASVNVGYAYGSIETFEYTRALANASTQVTNDGVPIPFNDRRQP